MPDLAWLLQEGDPGRSLGAGNLGGSFAAPGCCERAAAPAPLLCVVCRDRAEIKPFKEANVNPRNPRTISALLVTC